MVGLENRGGVKNFDTKTSYRPEYFSVKGGVGVLVIKRVLFVVYTL